jgi:hypothetical protein
MKVFPQNLDETPRYKAMPGIPLHTKEGHAFASEHADNIPKKGNVKVYRISESGKLNPGDFVGLDKEHIKEMYGEYHPTKKVKEFSVPLHHVQVLNDPTYPSGQGFGGFAYRPPKRGTSTGYMV